MIKRYVGQRIGKLVIVDAVKASDGHIRWICKCDCGNQVSKTSNQLGGKNKKDCGCVRGRTALVDLTGKRFGKLVVLHRIENSPSNKVRWLVKCDCGTVKPVLAHVLLQGQAHSCKIGHSRIGVGESAFNTFYKQVQNNAESRNMDFCLTKEQVREISQKKCFYCGKEPSQRIKSKLHRVVGDFIYNGIDRVDNTKGYTIDNCVPCCKTCNWCKVDRTVDEFRVWVDRVYHNFVRPTLSSD